MTQSDGDARLRSEVDRTREATVEVRRHLHRHPELSYQERATADLIADRCEAMGYAVRAGVADTGLIADLDSGRPGRTVMVRADIDALPIAERGVARVATSETEGVMHACGHDGHVAIGLGAGAVLAALAGTWTGRVRLCFQPAEEVADGAERMIAGGALEGVDRVLGLHLWAPLQVGRVGVKPGTIFSSADEFRLTVHGRGGHGGMPHTTVDPMIVAAQVMLALQTVISRETSPFAPAVITIGRIEGGTAFNVIAEEVRLRGTVRALEASERDRLLRRVEEVARGVAEAARARVGFERGHGAPPVVSDPDVAELVRQAAVATVGEDMVDVAETLTVGDDMSCFLDRVPGCYFLVGAGDVAAHEVAPHHHPEFDIDERCLPVGVEALSRAALEVLR
ncbi:MAG: M20 family metallopeptidase [Candidatus Dormibacteria bacterium]